jgi:hypothetical protein
MRPEDAVTRFITKEDQMNIRNTENSYHVLPWKNCLLAGVGTPDRNEFALRSLSSCLVSISSSKGAESTTPGLTRSVMSEMQMQTVPKGAIHVPNTVADICEGIQRMQRERDSLHRGILVLHVQLQKEWAQRSRDLWRLLST